MHRLDLLVSNLALVGKVPGLPSIAAVSIATGPVQAEELLESVSYFLGHTHKI